MGILRSSLFLAILTPGSSISPAEDCAVEGPAVPDGAVRFANTTVEIHAPARSIWNTLVNMEKWAEWNDVFSVKGAGVFGSKMFFIDSYFRTAPVLLRRSIVLMNLTEFDISRKICWEPQGFPGLWGRHCYVLCETPAGTRVYNYEDHKGPLEPIVHKMMSQPTTDGFNRFNMNLTAKITQEITAVV
eukprot:TRINITY_DN9787_c0_g1_i1.p1 TRINITY_DN9787_c0_g1~~TRINITY_DN9787_c0_g1_i1.p1  ORF type:complete len:187 (-),score=24.48 TRINITY_DN9787_c0_g1_i1:53-613(-)